MFRGAGSAHKRVMTEVTDRRGIGWPTLWTDREGSGIARQVGVDEHS
jgi:hypothetical protein